MITRFLTDVRVTFNPFSMRAKPARLFLSLIPPNARMEGMKIESKMLPRESKDPASLAVKFSTYISAYIWTDGWRGTGASGLRGLSSVGCEALG
jgi:hypothetical protein